MLQSLQFPCGDDKGRVLIGLYVFFVIPEGNLYDLFVIPEGNPYSTCAFVVFSFPSGMTKGEW